MKKAIVLFLLVLALCLGLAAAEGNAKDEPSGWRIPAAAELTDEARAAFDKATETLLGVRYDPLALLGEKDGAFCILCRAVVVYPGASPYYALMYVNGNGVQSIRALDLEEEAAPDEPPQPTPDDEAQEEPVTYATLFSDPAAAWEAQSRINADLAALDDALASHIADEWASTYLSPGYRLWLDGSDDPATLPITGRHAFVVLGYELQDGEMTEELKARCDAAAAAARAFPASILVCSGGATGANNPLGHTEAGLMKDYLVQNCGVDAARIFVDERAQSTVDNALNTFAILKKQGVEEITPVTSSYHQRRAHMLYDTLAAFIDRTEGYRVTVAGNYGCKIEKPEEYAKMDTLIAAFQLDEMLRQLFSGQRVIREIAVNYGAFGAAADAVNEALLKELEAVNPDAGARWHSILTLWKGVEDETVFYGALPDGLPDTDALCIVTLGFQLNPDGTMKDELIERLRVALRSAEKYPNAYIVCTGGGTAAENEAATEAGKMAEWLIANGVAADRVIVEDSSLTTAQNAIYTYDILSQEYPQVTQLAIVSSDYHIATGKLLFEAEAILRAEKAGEEKMSVVANAAYKAPSGSLSPMFQAGALIELSGDMQTAFDIYYETYTIHDLPPLP